MLNTDPLGSLLMELLAHGGHFCLFNPHIFTESTQILWSGTVILKKTEFLSLFSQGSPTLIRNQTFKNKKMHIIYVQSVRVKLHLKKSHLK